MAVHVMGAELNDLLQQDWLSVNHLGGYACCTPTGLNTRKYHGLLIAAMSPPVRRMVLLSRMEETIHVHGTSFPLSAAEYPDTIHPRGFDRLVAFDSSPYPRWAYQSDGWTLQKELRLLPQRNAVLLQYTLLGCSSPVTMECRPLLAMRGIHERMYQWNGQRKITELARGHLRIEATSRTPEVYLAHDGTFDQQPLWYLNNIYRQEEKRGYASLEDLWTPGVVRWTLSPGKTVHFVCSADPVLLEQVIHEANQVPVTIDTTHLPFSQDVDAAVLLQAAAKFSPFVCNDPAIAQARMITQYPWSPPSGRDTLIALPGLLLTTHRFNEAALVLDSFVREMSGGIMPSSHPEDGSAPRYDGADVSLWFIHAVGRYLKATGEDAASHPTWVEATDRIIEMYRLGSAQTAHLGIEVDIGGLLCSHAPGQATTWMDAKCGDWVVTPRGGRAVEVNALWHNAICVAAELMRSTGQSARSEELALLATSVRHAFARTFWNEEKHCCFDVVGDKSVDASIRPNQLFAISLPYPVLATEYHAAVLQVVRNHLLTRVGLRSLDLKDAAYCGHYHGDPVARDRAQHQGSAYPWLLGAYADALLRVQGNNPSTRSQIAQGLASCIEHIRGSGLGHLAELFDGNAPHSPGGAIASARSLGEVLRAYVTGVLNVDGTQSVTQNSTSSPTRPQSEHI